MTQGAPSRALLRIAWGLVAAVISVGVLAVPARSAEERIAEAGSVPIRYPKGIDRGGANASLIVNSALRRGYQFFYDSPRQRTTGRVIDLDTYEVLVERVLPAQYFPTGILSASTLALAGEWVHTLNPETGDVYLGASNDGQVGGFYGIVRLDPRTLAVKGFFSREAFTYEPSVDVNPADPELPCAATACLPQAPTAVPQLRGLAFAETYLTGLSNKLLLLMQESISAPTLENNFNIAYVAQWDAETGHQDWIYRSQACSNAALPGRDAGLFALGIFQARLGSGIYVACQASGGTGQVVRLQVDSLNSPSAEQAYPGPQSVVDAVADPESDRMILRVQNEDGDSWWVFDGPSSSYTGVIGGTLSRVTAVAAGIDQSSGRLYMLAPPTNKDAQESAGGLLMSDVRRSPAPQFLSFEEYAGAWEGTIRVDVHPGTGERLVIAHRKEAADYTILRDGVPISSDPPIQDRDRLTVNVEEDPKVTGRNFTGSGHAYGVRVLLAGGLEGFPPAGPDAGGVRVGRYAPLMVGSPCGPGDRELVVASVDNAGLSNNLSSAGASVGNADPGTKTDIGEPTARCYPRPRDLEGHDVWTRDLPAGAGTMEDHAGDYPRPNRQELDDAETGAENESKTDLDELVGNSWPFVPMQCSGDDKASTDTRLRPFDRGDTETGPFTPEQREEEVVLDGFRAHVVCDQTGASVAALAEIVTHEQQGPALDVEIPEIGVLRIAEASSTTVIYLDPERGLVSRSIAAARGIQIGDHVFIEGAFAIAEAWAAGRPGTAGTHFSRYICGVRLKDEAPDQHVFRPNPQVNQEELLAGNPEAIDPNLEGGGEVDKSPDKSVCGDPDESLLGTVKQYTGIDDNQPLLDAINRVLGTRGRVSSPKPDGQLSQGTPGGYLASVQKDRLNEISSRAVNNDASTQVPALELLVFNDDRNQGRGRQVYQFAGVDASVTYGIYLLNPPMDDPGCAPYCVEDAIDNFLPPRVPFEEPAAPVGDPPPPAQGPITMLFEGLNFLLRSPTDALLAAAVWAILFAPAQLASRRRALRAVR